MDSLDREQSYRLWFDPATYRWEVEPIEERPGRLEERADAPASDATTPARAVPQLVSSAHR